MGSTYTLPSQFISVDANGVEQTYTVTQLGNMILQQISEQSSLEVLVLPSGLGTLSQNIAFMPTNIRSFEIAESNTVYSTVDGVIYSKDGTVLLYYPKSKNDSEFIIPETVKTIADGAFSNNEFIRKIVCNHSVTFAGNVFYNCVILSEVRFTSADPSLFIGVGTFDKCNSALKIYVPEASIEAYKNSIIFDFNARDKITPYTE
jgi:hypothetical protein